MTMANPTPPIEELRGLLVQVAGLWGETIPDGPLTGWAAIALVAMCRVRSDLAETALAAQSDGPSEPTKRMAKILGASFETRPKPVEAVERFPISDDPATQNQVAGILLLREARALEQMREAADAMQWIIDHCNKLRKGTDDWFELVEISAFASRALAAIRKIDPHSLKGEG